MKTTMNIFDLSWCKFYMYDERFNIGFPLIGASVSMATIVGMYLVGLAIFPASVGVYKLPHLPFWPFGIGFGIIIALFIIRHRKKDIRMERLDRYQQYKKQNPRKNIIRFLVFIISPVLLWIADFTIANA